MKSSPKSEPAGGEAGGLGGRRIGKQPKPEYSAPGGKLLRKWLAIRAAASDPKVSAASDFRVLIVILDRMDDDLVCWPMLETVAADAGVSRRAVMYSINRLVQAGYLIRESGGRRQSNRYRLPKGERSCTQAVNEPAPIGEESCASRVNDLAPNGEESCTSGVKGFAPESRNRNQTAVNPEKEAGEGKPARAREDHPPPVDVDEVAKAFKEICPMLRSAGYVTSKRRKKIRETSKLDSRLETIEGWRDYFDAVAASDFLTGKAKPANGYANPFEATFDWLIDPENAVKVMEGNYDGTESIGGASRRYLD